MVSLFIVLDALKMVNFKLLSSISSQMFKLCTYVASRILLILTGLF